MRALAAVLLVPALASIAWPQSCSSADLKGVYLSLPSGFIQMKDLDPNFPDMMAPMKGLGLVEYDGNGKGTGRGMATFGGMPASFEFVDLKYAVNADCTGTLEYRVKLLPAGAVFGPDKFKLLVLREGGAIRGLMVDSPGLTAIGTVEATRLSYHKPVCHQSMLRGMYVNHYDGWVNMQAINPNQSAYFAPAMGVGVMRIDPEKGDSGGGAHNWGGVALDSEMVSDSVQVNADCTMNGEFMARVKQTGTMTNQKYQGIMKPDGSEFYLINGNFPAVYFFSRAGM